MMQLKEKLKKQLEEELPKNVLPLLPSRFPIIGYAALIRLKEALYPYGGLIGDTLVEVSEEIESVWTFTGRTKGKRRIPQIKWLAGKKNPEVLHKEYNTLFTLDVSRLTFSPGNTGERGQIIRMVEDDQTLVDLFACCGNLTLPAAVNNSISTIWMMEINPLAYHYLLENIYLNDLVNKAIPLFGDNHNFPVENIGDHVFLGILPQPDLKQLEIGINALKKQGGWLHYHTSVEKEAKAREHLRRDITEKVKQVGREVIETKFDVVKGLSAQFDHVVLRMFVVD